MLSGPDCALPGAQVPTGAQPEEFATVEYVPVAHGSQPRSAEALGGIATRCPAMQSFHSAQFEELSDAENEPGGHAVHMRSVVPVGSCVTQVPGGQSEGDRPAQVPLAVQTSSVVLAMPSSQR